jgi:hypothetical protein
MYDFRGRAQPLPHMPPSNGLFITCKQIVSDSRHSHGKALCFVQLSFVARCLELLVFMLEGGRPAIEGGELMASPSWTLPTGRSVLMEPDTDRSSVEAKTARLAAAKERQRTLRRQATAATIILQLSAHRTCLLCRTLQQWRTALALQAAAAARLPAPSTPRLRLHLAGASAATPAATPRPTAPTERVSSDDELAALRSALATTRRARAQSEARAEVERRLLVRELMAEADVRVDSVEREKQSIVLAHLYEKQELRTSHQRALQKAEFAKLDMLAQQEARTRVREKQLYEHALSQIGQLKAQLSERSEAAERYIELVRAQEEADEERARATPTHGAARVDAHDDAVSGVATPDPFPTCGASAGAAPAAEGADAESESGATDTALPPRPPPIAAGDSPETAPAATPAATPPATPTAAQPKSRAVASAAEVGSAVASAADVGSAAGHCTSRGSTALTPRRLAVAATAEADALRAALAKADAKAEAARAAHADEIGQCDTQAARLREALTMLEQRLRMTEEALKVARQQATEAEAARSRALMETQDSMREAAELRQQLAAPSSRSGTARGTTRPLCTPREATAAAAGAASAEGIRRAHHSAGSAHQRARCAHHSAGSAAGLRSAAHPRSAAGAALSLPRCALPSPTEKGAVAGGSGSATSEKGAVAGGSGTATSEKGAVAGGSGTATAEAASVAGGAAGVPGLQARLPAGLAEQLRLPLERIGRFEFDASNEGDYAHFENEAASADEIEGDEIEGDETEGDEIEGDEIERGGFSARWGDDAESLRESIGALDEELLLSQRALDFLAELPLTPAAASRASSRASSLPSPSAPGCLSFGAFASGAPGTVGNGNASSASSSPEIAARPDTTPLGKRANTKFGKSGAAPPPLPRQKLTVDQKL